MRKASSRKKKGNNKNSKYLLLFLVGSIFVIGIAYAALSSTLTATMNKVTQTAGSWSVGFTPGTVNGTKGGTSTGDITCGTATVTTNSVTVANTALSKPDDSCTYALTIANTGSIDAKLDEITLTKPSSTECTVSGASMLCGNITYKLATNTDGTSLLTTNTTLAKGTGSINVFLIIKYTGTTVNNSAVEQSNGKFTLVYNQV